MRALLHRIARRCPTHDRPSPSKTRSLELELGMEPSPPPTSLVEAYSNPDLIDCGHAWCRRRRTP